MKSFIYKIISLLAVIFICALPVYAAGAGGYRGSGGSQWSGGNHGSGGYRGSGGYQGSGGYHGYSGYRGYSGYNGSGRYYGHGGYNGHGNSYNARIFIGPGWGPGWWGAPYPYYPYYSYYPAPPVVVEQQPQVYNQQNQQESDYWYYCQEPDGYYPYVKSCPGGWMKVVPEPAAPGR